MLQQQTAIKQNKKALTDYFGIFFSSVTETRSQSRPINSDSLYLKPAEPVYPVKIELQDTIQTLYYYFVPHVVKITAVKTKTTKNENAGWLEVRQTNGDSIVQNHRVEALYRDIIIAMIIFLTPVLNSQGMKKLRYAIHKSTKIKLE